MLRERTGRRSLAIAITQRRRENAVVRGRWRRITIVISDVDVGGEMPECHFHSFSPCLSRTGMKENPLLLLLIEEYSAIEARRWRNDV